ncbi:hypothetical protein JCGZ_05941 [Jatropha curcas]|uniref:Uncharacterized protein n=1 Tax=Jatropha curcas TaxID=180498 RepID=A0A067KMZ0_JATCU|nr:uncharacterized protein LOC105634567 [Jatropha curcas]KDP37502.1 hypothetical protein JCGZ_05941 [Jatropha curcas]
MPLVDYASSSDDDVSEDREEEEPNPQNEPQLPKHGPASPTIPPNNHSGGGRYGIASHAPPTASTEKLPDASLLLNSPTVSFVTGTGTRTGTDHTSRVAVAMAESASRKRESNGLSSTSPRNKVPKGNLPHTKNVPDTVGSVLVPPQLSGRSNIVTEDIGKLFVRKHAEHSSSQRNSSSV